MVKKGYVYLINAVGTNKYKIGVTCKNDVNERVKELQTGNGEELELVNYFFTDYPYRVEKNLHLLYHVERKKGEWFEFNNSEPLSFLNECKKMENLILILVKSGNPFIS